MKTFTLALLLCILAGCGGGSKPQIAIPPDADLKADVMIRGKGESRSIEVSFYFSRPVAPGVKTEPTLEVIPVEETRFNDTQLTQETNAVGRIIYTGSNLQLKPENLIAATLNGRRYEGKAIQQTTLENKSVSVVMVPK